MIADTSGAVLVAVALIGAAAALIGPSAVIIVTSRTRSREKREDWKRLDDVKEAVQTADAERLTAIQGVSSDIATLQEGQVVIHDIVNSRMTSKLDRIEQLIETLVAAGVDVPVDPNPTD